MRNKEKKIFPPLRGGQEGLYIKLCHINDLPEKTGRKFSLDDDTDVAVFKIDGKVYAVSNVCPHNQSNKLHEGFVDKELYVSCPVHGWKFSIETGLAPPDCKGIFSKLETYKTKVENGEVFVEKKKRKLKFFRF
jgi:3-phenylpropionate/trans-cinnamate dioxygenase ferredoxin subunit